MTGNPALSAEVQDIYQTIKNLEKRNGGAARDHAEAMTIEVQRKIMLWSEQRFPAMLTPSEQLALVSREDLMEVAKHCMIRAYMSAGFTLVHHRWL